jgi:hypothetical protein
VGHASPRVGSQQRISPGSPTQAATAPLPLAGIIAASDSATASARASCESPAVNIALIVILIAAQYIIMSYSIALVSSLEVFANIGASIVASAEKILHSSRSLLEKISLYGAL